MAFDGNGTFNRLYNWVTDKTNGIKINASRMDAEMNGMATGLSTCLTKDGQTNPTANLPMATYRHTGVGNASERNEYAAAGQVQDSSTVYAADTGAADAYVITLTPAPSAYAAGQTFTFKATNGSTGASTLNVNGLGVKTIKKNNDQDIGAGDIEAGQIVTVTYDGTNFQMTSVTAVAGTPADGSITLAKLADLANLKVIGNTSGSTGTPQAVSILDEDNMASDSATAIATQQSIKAYVDGKTPAATDTTAGIVELATNAEAQTGTDTTRAVTPASMKYAIDEHQSSVKAWVVFNGTGTVAINDSYNVTSITDHGVGDYSANWSSGFPTANYVVVGNTNDVIRMINITSKATGSVRINVYRSSDASSYDVSAVHLMAIGD